MTDAELADAKSKYHLLVTGQAPRVVLDGNDGSRVEYQGANADRLLEYIRITDPTFLAVSAPYVRRPLGFTF